MIYIIISILAGVTIVIGRTINSNLAERIGIFQGTFFNYVVGLLFSIIFLIFSKETFPTTFNSFSSIPFLAYLGGLLGVITIVISNYMTPRISSFYLTLFIFIGQLFMGVIIDYTNIGTVSIGKVIGGILVLIGLTYNLIVDKNDTDCD
ncbi:MAG: DMT family transporter [Clostridium sp.]